MELVNILRVSRKKKLTKIEKKGGRRGESEANYATQFLFNYSFSELYLCPNKLDTPIHTYE
jgi:hypothetical protein